MVGTMPFAKLFRSRWTALLWAGGILWTAYDVAGSAPSPPPLVTSNTGDVVDVTGRAISNDDLNMLAHFGDGATGH